MSYRVPTFPGVHLPGSVPLPDAEAVFQWVGSNLGPWARRVPDGETGLRALWVGAQMRLFAENATLEAGETRDFLPFPRYRVREGANAEFPRLEYPDWARESYALFTKQREAGMLPEDARFMVGWPHPMDTVMVFADSSSFQAMYDAYERQTERSVRELVEAIPPEDLALQWEFPGATNLYCGIDISVMGTLDFDDPAGVRDALVRASEWVPEDVQLGFHLCFGDLTTSETGALSGLGIDDSAADDASGLTRLVNDLSCRVKRPIDFVHLPTHAHWLQRRHFAPLGELELDQSTDLYVGVINLRRDATEPLEVGAQRARQRAQAVRDVIGPAGVSTSCGMGRHTPEEFATAQELYKELASSAA